MQRPVVLVVALSVMAAACALVEPPPPPGTTPIAVQVTNDDPFEVELAVTTPSGVLAGAVQPPHLPPGATIGVVFYLPAIGNWTITVNGTPMFIQGDLDVRGCPGGVNYMEVSVSGAGGIGCRTPP